MRITKYDAVIVPAIVALFLATAVLPNVMAQESNPGVNTAPFQANEKTLTIVVVGGILGVAMRNGLGYYAEKKKDPKNTDYNVGLLIQTVVFALPLGTMLAASSVMLLNIDVGDSLIKAFVLLMMTLINIVGIDWLKNQTSSKPVPTPVATTTATATTSTPSQ